MRDGDEQFRNVVATIKDYAIVLLSPDGIVLTWNMGAQCATGYADRDIIGRSIECLYTPESRAAGRPGLLLATAHAEGRVEDVDWRVRKDGTRFWADVVITALRDDGGRLIGFAAVSRDLTACPQQAQTFLLRTGDELASSLDYETTLQRVVRQAVPSLADVCFVDVVDDSRLRPLAVAHVDPAKEAWLLERTRHLDQSPPVVLHVLRTGQPLVLPAVSETALFATADEDQLPVNPELITAVRDLGPSSAISVPLIARGHDLGVLSLVRLDGSPPFGTQDLVLIEHLAHQCALAVDNARLYREAQEAVRARNEFLAATSHELRRPLSEIKGFATTLLRPDVHWDEPTRQDFLQEIDREADLLDTLIKDLLDMSSLASGARQRFDRAPAPPAVVVSGGVDRVRGHLPHRVQLDIDPDLGALPPVWVDVRRVEQVLANLVENATKYAPGSAIHVSGALVNTGHEVELWVEDDGPGISADDMAHIFDKFYRGRSAVRSEVPGTGLGLPIAQAIVEGHGGHIRAENRRGGGARFVFSLPVASRRLDRGPADLR